MRGYNFIANTNKGVLFLPPSDGYIRSFLYLLYTLIKLYYTIPLSDQASSLEAKNPGIFLWFSNNHSITSTVFMTSHPQYMTSSPLYHTHYTCNITATASITSQQLCLGHDIHYMCHLTHCEYDKIKTISIT